MSKTPLSDSLSSQSDSSGYESSKAESSEIRPITRLRFGSFDSSSSQSGSSQLQFGAPGKHTPLVTGGHITPSQPEKFFDEGEERDEQWEDDDADAYDTKDNYDNDYDNE